MNLSLSRFVTSFFPLFFFFFLFFLKNLDQCNCHRQSPLCEGSAGSKSVLFLRSLVFLGGKGKETVPVKQEMMGRRFGF